MDDPDREADAVHPRQRGRIEVLRVLAHGEDRCLGLPDSLALDEVRVDSRGAVDPGVGQLLGDLAGPVLERLDQPDADLLLEEDVRDGERRSPPRRR